MATDDCAWCGDEGRERRKLSTGFSPRSALGWKWAIESTPDGIPRIYQDATHLNAKGCYLAGAVWFSVLTGLHIDTNIFMPSEIPVEDVAFLRSVAASTASI